MFDVVAWLALVASQSSSLHHLTQSVKEQRVSVSNSVTSGWVWESSLGEQTIRTRRTREN